MSALSALEAEVIVLRDWIEAKLGLSKPEIATVVAAEVAKVAALAEAHPAEAAGAAVVAVAVAPEMSAAAAVAVAVAEVASKDA